MKLRHLLGPLALCGIFCVHLQAKEGLDLVPVGGDSAEETVPQKVGFRFALTAYLMPDKDGAYALTFSPYIKPSEESDLGDFMIAGYLIDQETDAEVESFMVTAQNTVQSVNLKANRLYRLEVTSMKNDEPADLTGSIIFPTGMRVALLASEENSSWLDGVSGVIFVPPGCKEILCFGEPRLSLISPSGVRTDVSVNTSETEGLAKVPVDSGEDGQFWKVGNQTRGKVFFAGEVPPLINLNQADLLLPKEK